MLITASPRGTSVPFVCYFFSLILQWVKEQWGRKSNLKECFHHTTQLHIAGAVWKTGHRRASSSLGFEFSSQRTLNKSNHFDTNKSCNLLLRSTYVHRWIIQHCEGCSKADGRVGRPNTWATQFSPRYAMLICKKNLSRFILN